MAEIEITLQSTGDSATAGRTLEVDGLAISGITISDSHRHPLPRLYVYINSPEASRIADVLLTDLEEHFSVVSVLIDPCIGDFFGRVEVAWEKVENEPPVGITFWPTARLDEWARPYSVAELSETIRREVEGAPTSDATFVQRTWRHPTRSPDFGVAFPFAPAFLTIGDLVSHYGPVLDELFDRGVKALLEEARRNSLVTFFEFPKSVRTACEQYLVYFSQFLADLGIEADAEIKEDAHHILFSVTPTDGEEALEQIRVALEAFLRLPGSGLVQEVAASPEIAHQQLAAQVMHLQSQLMLARATHIANTAAIESLQLTAFKYRQMLLSPHSATLPDVRQSEEEDRIELFGGTVVVTPYKGSWFEVNVVKILRMLKRRP